MMPMKLTSENVSGTASSCGSPAADGRDAREAKSGAFLQQAWVKRPESEGKRASYARNKGSHVTYARHEA
jgi:hypothetical protein